MNCTCNASHAGHCEAAPAADKHYYLQQQLAGAGLGLQGYGNQGLQGLVSQGAGQQVTNPASAGETKAKKADLSIRDELVKNARELLRRGRSTGNLNEFGQAIALLDCAVRVGSL